MLSTLRPISTLLQRHPLMTNITLAQVISHSNGEGLLALGKKLRLSECTVYELELLPGIGDEIANRFMRSRDKLRLGPQTWPKRQRLKSLMALKDPGERTAHDCWLHIDPQL